MLPKINRLAGQRDFQQALRSKFTAQNAFFKVILSKSRQKEVRFGFVVSRKIFKKANKRNRLRRRVQARFLAVSQQIKPGLNFCNCIILSKNPQALQLKDAQVTEHLTNLFQQARDNMSSFFLQRKQQNKQNKSRTYPTRRISSGVEQ